MIQLSNLYSFYTGKMKGFKRKRTFYVTQLHWCLVCYSLSLCCNICYFFQSVNLPWERGDAWGEVSWRYLTDSRHRGALQGEVGGASCLHPSNPIQDCNLVNSTVQYSTGVCVFLARLRGWLITRMLSYKVTDEKLLNKDVFEIDAFRCSRWYVKKKIIIKN